MPPLSLSAEEMQMVQSLALPIDPRERDAFLQAVAAALASEPVRGPGVAHQVGRRIQREFFTPPQLRPR